MTDVCSQTFATIASAEFGFLKLRGPSRFDAVLLDLAATFQDNLIRDNTSYRIIEYHPFKPQSLEMPSSALARSSNQIRIAKQAMVPER